MENGYLDIYLERDIRMPEVKYEWLLELKYLKKSERKKLPQILKEGLTQLKRYRENNTFANRSDLRAVLVFVVKDEFYMEELYKL